MDRQQEAENLASGQSRASSVIDFPQTPLDNVTLDNKVLTDMNRHRTYNVAIDSVGHAVGYNWSPEFITFCTVKFCVLNLL